ncbi:hypothetical protein QR680_016193 [Steinernema hermaphroditum]|uniref:Anaphase-promoting complex subunit 2 n=1 Tax=Steinernema hermaphroditum TaxID=289476 RepID=A0AA39HBG9_9BILA|nr:hypothetical protein QR680_016193 [Steinernema hermaphroditum]
MSWDRVESMEEDSEQDYDSFEIVNLKGEKMRLSHAFLRSEQATFDAVDLDIKETPEERSQWYYFQRNFVLREIHTWIIESDKIGIHMLPYKLYEMLMNLHVCLRTYADIHEIAAKRRFYDDGTKIIFSKPVVELMVPVLRRLIKLSFYLFKSEHYKPLLLERTGLASGSVDRTNQLAMGFFIRINRLLLARRSVHMSVKDLTDIYVAATHHIIDRYVLDETAKKTWDRKYDQLCAFARHVKYWAMEYMIEPMHHKHLTEQVDMYARQKLIDSYIENIYDIVVTCFPHSYFLAEDLKLCIVDTQGYGRVKLADCLVREVKDRLLNVGVTTNDILRAYASAVDCLKVIDPSSVIMHKVCGIIKDYLKTRQDTVKNIIMYITTEKRDELTRDSKEAHVVFDEEGMREVNADFMVKEDADTWQSWNPDPVDANKGDNPFFRESADVFNMLVSVYGSKDQFIKEYRQLLGERLTSTNERDLSFETRYLELMKRRFTEGELQQCEVMLRDMSDSEAFDRMKMTPEIPFCMQGRIISSFFWPKLDTETVKVPDVIANAMDVYRQAFEDQKGNQRTLNWMNSLGYMDLDVEIYGKTIHITLPTAQAAILMKFLEKDSWNVDELCQGLDMKKSVIKRRCEWFSKNGLLRQKIVENSVAEWYTLADQPALLEKFEKRLENEEEESDEEEEPAENTEAIDALEQFWTYTKNFISNQEPVKAERIHTIFKMFASPGKQGPTIADVTGFLQRKVRANMLTYNNGYYRAVKDNLGP